MFHGAPLGGVIGEEVGGDGANLFGGLGESTAAESFEEAEIAFFLSGHEVMDQHGALGGDGFVDGGSAGFTDDKVMAIKKLGHAFGPATDPDATRELALELFGTAIEETHIFSENDGQVDIRRSLQQGARNAANVRFFGGGEIEYAKGFRGCLAIHAGHFRKGGVHGEAGIDNFFLRKTSANEGLSRKGIGDEPCGGRSFFPRGVDLNGIGDDSEDGRLFWHRGENALEEVGIERIGANDGGGLVGGDSIGEKFFWLAHVAEALAGKIHIIGGKIDPIPNTRCVGGDPAVQFAEKIRKVRSSGAAGVEDFAFHTESSEGEREIARGAVVAFAKGGSEDENAWRGHEVNYHGLWDCVEQDFHLGFSPDER